MEEIDSLRWINSKFGSNIKVKDVKNVLDFLLFWNLFESQVAGTEFSIEKVEQYINDRQIDHKAFEEAFRYYRNRYVKHGEPTPEWEAFQFRANDKKERVWSILNTGASNKKDFIFALFKILQRLRNNLFHGVKDADRLPFQDENFKAANKVLKVLLDRY